MAVVTVFTVAWLSGLLKPAIMQCRNFVNLHACQVWRQEKTLQKFQHSKPQDSAWRCSILTACDQYTFQKNTNTKLLSPFWFGDKFVFVYIVSILNTLCTIVLSSCDIPFRLHVGTLVQLTLLFLKLNPFSFSHTDFRKFGLSSNCCKTE